MNKILCLGIAVVCLVGGASAYWTEMKEIRTTASWLGASTPERTILNVEEYIRGSFVYEEGVDAGYQEPYQLWRSGVGDCTDFAELARTMLKYNDIKTERVRSVTPNDELHDMLFSAYGFVNPLNTQILRVNGGGYW